jgi:signal transduction histidine kinase/CheY-like chemotaxis protein
LQTVDTMSVPQTEAELHVAALLDKAHQVRVNDLKQSMELANEALVLSQQHGTETLTAKSYSRLAFYNMILGQFDEALRLAAQSIRGYEKLKDEAGLAEAKFTVASVHYKTDNMSLGLKYLVECLSIYRKYDDYPNQARAYKTMGTIYEFFEDIPNAVQSYESAVAAAEKAGDLNMVSNAYNPLSGLALNRNDIAGAMEIIEKSIAIKKQTGDVRGIAFAYYGRGKIYTKTGEFDKALADFTESQRIHTEMGEKLGLCMTLHKTGAMYFTQGLLEPAREMLEKANELSGRYNVIIIQSRTNRLLYEVCKRQHDTEKAFHYLERYVADKELFEKNQSQQIVASYNLIYDMEARAMNDRMQLEKAEIEEKKNKAEYTARAKQEFLSNMSHEIRTPLNAVITITNLLKERKEDPEEQKLLESLRFASNNLLLLINDVLDFTKIETGKMHLEPRPAHLRNLLGNILNTYEGLAKEKGLALRLVVDEVLAEAFEVDETKLSQILGNLLSNAIKFTDQGWVSLSVSKGAEKDGETELQFRVTDTGIGIPKDFLSEIFESFSQPRSITTKKQGGSGLGLAIVKKLVELHQSDIHIETKEGRGSVFYFSLWLKPCQLTNTKIAQQGISLAGRQVLMADDNAINILVATKLLSKWGVKTDCARNGVEAVAKAREKKYDVILMDIHMPEMNGYDATSNIRQTVALNQQTPIYALTADVTAGGGPGDEQFNGFLRKPIEIEQLYQALSAAD